MSRYCLRLLAAWLCLGVLAPAASACINDRESDKAEKEFKSRYIDQQTPTGTTPTSPAPENRVLTVSATAVGAVLLIGAVTITVLPRRRQQ
jgi:hypothetical protein